MNDQMTRGPVVPRRAFLTTGLAIGAAGMLGTLSRAAETTPASQPASGLLDSPPVVQCASATGCSIAFAVKRNSSGWVEWGHTPDLGNKAVGAAHGLANFSDRFQFARIDGAEAGKPVYYRIAAAAITYKSAYKIERGEPEFSKVHCVRLPDAKADRATFAAIDDTHENKETLAAIFAKIDKDQADAIVWNGDVFNDIRTDQQIVEQVLRPAGAEYAAQRPLYFVPGNHDVRGVGARNLHKAFLPWPDGESPGRCFAVRHGPMAMIGLDTGEDKPDAHPVFAGLASFEPYRKAQASWLKKSLARPEIASAPFIVVFCHIPLWGLPGDNPGDTLEGYASYSRFGQRLWGAALQEAKVSLLVCGHTHKPRWDPPAEGHCYPQIVGGGPKLDQATIIRGEAEAERLKIVQSRPDGTVIGKWEVRKRG